MRFNVQKIYLKNLSFESPNAPHIFQAHAENKVDVNFKIQQHHLGEDMYDISLTATVEIMTELDAKKTVVFVAEAEMAGVFEVGGFTAEQFEVLTQAEAPQMLLPYVRHHLSQITTDGGFPPFLLQPVNFHAGYLEQKQAQQQAANPAIN